MVYDPPPEDVLEPELPWEDMLVVAVRFDMFFCLNTGQVVGWKGESGRDRVELYQQYGVC